MLTDMCHTISVAWTLHGMRRGPCHGDDFMTRSRDRLLMNIHCRNYLYSTV